MTLSALQASHPLHDILTYPQQLICLEQALYATFTLKFGSLFVPDYAL